MIDYTKIEIPDWYWPHLSVHPLLSFTRPINEDTAEYKETDAREAEYCGMVFTRYPSGRITLRGSWHKYYHKGTNWQDFTLGEFREAVREFCDTFNLDPSRLQLLQLEAGCNVTPPIPTRETLHAFVSNWKGNAFGTMRTDKGQPLGIELYLTDYGLKVYDKGAQYGLLDPLMRFERKFTSWSKFRNKTNIHVLADLLHVEAWQTLADLVEDSFTNLILREPSVNPEQLPTSERLFFADAGRAGYWHDAPRKERHNARERLRGIVRDHGKSDLYEDLLRLLNSKLKELIYLAEGDETGNVFHDVPDDSMNHERERFPTSINDGIRSIVDTPTEEGERAATSDEFTVRGCRTCGRDISGQRPGSVFCSERLYGRAAKRCRNADSNPRNGYARRLNRIERDPLLFDHSPFLRMPEFTGDSISVFLEPNEQVR